MLVHKLELVPVADEGGADEPVVVTDESDPSRLPDEHVSESRRIRVVRVRRRRLGRTLPDDRVLAIGRTQGEVEHERFEEVGTLEDEEPEGATVAGADRVPLATLDSGIADRSGLDAGDIEGVAVHQPSRGLVRSECQVVAGAHREVLRAIGDVDDELRGGENRAGCRVKVRDLEERRVRMEEVES